MLNQLLVNFLLTRNLFPVSQHGFIPGRGTMTAWKELLERALGARDIYEFDLKSFFDSVRLDAISEELRNHDVPR